MQFSVLKNKYPKSKRFEEAELITLTLAKAPDSYKCVLTAESRVKGSALTMQDIEDAMLEQFRLSNNKITGDGDRDK